MNIGRIALAALAVSLPALAADPFVGKWKLTESTQKDVRIGAVTAIGEIPGGIRLTMPGSSRPLDLVVGEQEQPPGGGSTTRRIGADARIIRRPNSRTIEVVFRRQGKDAGTSKRVVSEDGRTLTATMDGVDLKGEKIHEVDTYERQ